ncbi:MAG: sigma 54-interacting transcriptional regulator [Humidesulfovibrio sp.]|nr:sigma 54-interacting transcriptional regulator [Humidesulfovibrio sp.]
MKDTPESQIPPEENDPLSSLPDWFTQREIIPLEDHLALVVCHETMRAIVALCRVLADAPAPVLLTGETGVGKSLLSRFIHASGDPYAPFVSHLTAGLDARMLLERIFGPDSPSPDEGTPRALIEEASGGTLVLEEMGDLPTAVQQRLMALWDEQAAGSGDIGPRQFICTTNTPRRLLLAPGALLPEFLERFRHIHVPPLRERKEDIPALVAYFSRLKTSRTASLKSLESLAGRLANHAFPGNVRELESLMALEAGGLPWRWRVTGADKACCVRPPVGNTAKRAGGRKKKA